MSLTVQNIIDQTSTDVRKVLDKTNDAALMVDWVNRINKDIMHNSIYAPILQTVASGTYVALTSLLTVTLTSPRRVLAVFDRVWNRPLLPLERALSPVPTGDQGGPPGGGPPGVRFEILTRSFWPEYFAYAGGSNVYVYPAPLAATGGADVFYEKTTTDLTLTTSVLDVPDDGKDIVVAGTNMIAAHYLKRIDEAGFWQKIYEQAKHVQVV